MSKYNSLSIRLSKEQRVCKQLLNKEALLDALVSLYHNATHCQRLHNKTNHGGENVDKFIQLYKPVYHELNKSRLSLKDFEILHRDAFAEGAFGKVMIVKSKRDNCIYALKTSSKTKLISQMDRSSPMEERLILSNQNEEWLPKLHASFQDEKNLYLVMEYAPGGDLQGLIQRRSCQPFLEDEARFYCAELILAVERIHQLGYMHRDVKPGNILIDKDGHIKLGDLGSCISIDAKNYLLMVGTMPYVSPEMCNSEGMDSSRGPAYGPEVDWWSVGVVLYELLYGELPFGGTDVKIQMSLLNPKVSVHFNSDIKVSDQAKNLLSKLLAKDKSKRLGCSTGAAEIKSHPFFKDINWDTLHKTAIPPFVPPITSPDDITFFSTAHLEQENEEGPKYNDDDDDDDDEVENEDEIKDNVLYNEYPFIGYTYIDDNSTQSSLSITNTNTTRGLRASGSNQEFIAQLRQKLSNNPEPRQWEDEKIKLKASHEEEIKKIKAEHEMELKRLQTLLDKQSTSSPNDEQKQLEEIQFENTNLRSSVNKLQTENEELRNLYSSTQNQMEAAKVENTRLKSSANQLENAQRRLETENAQLKASFELKSEAESRYKALETTEKELLVENEKLKLANGPEHEHKLKLVELKEINNTQKKELSHLKSEFRLLTDKNTSLHNQIKHYEDHLSSLEKENQSIQADRKNQILELQSDIQSLESKLSQETKNTEKIKLYYEEKIKSQASDYDQFIHQIKSECNDLKQRFDQLDEDNKARESLPASITESNLTSTVQEDKSILTAMWQRDREILKVAQKALEKSENDLALSRNQVLQLRKEVKYLQKQHVFEQSKGINDINEDINEDVDIAPPVKKDNVITYQTIQKMKKPVPPIPQSNKIENNKDARINIITSPISVLRDTKDDQQLLNSIKRERNLIQSTKKTIAARAKLSRAKGEVDRELSLSLERAHTTVSLLESQLKNKPFSPSDFLVTSKKPLV